MIRRARWSESPMWSTPLSCQGDLEAPMAIVLLTGATGFVGRHLIGALTAAGHQVRCATRTVEQARERSPELDWVRLDLLDPATLDPALAGCDAAIFLVHAMGAD